MVKNPDRNKEPIIMGLPVRSYLETDMESFGSHPCGGLFASHHMVFTNKTQDTIFMLKTLVCTQCGYVGQSDSKNKGSFAVEIILWCFFLFPGLIYSIWRRSALEPICSKCGNKSLIPITSPRASKIMEEQGDSEIAKIAIEKERVAENRQKRSREREVNVAKWLVIITVIFAFIGIISAL